MALNTKTRGLQINDAFFGKGLIRNAGDNNIMEIQVDDSTLEIPVDTVQVKDDGITNDKLANIAQGSVKVGGGSNAPTDLDAKTDGYILIGDGTDINSVSVTGDVTITNAGVTAIGATKVTDSMINDDVATGLAGVGLSATSGVLAVDLDEVDEVAIDVANDYITLLDNSDNGDTKKEAFADVVTAIAGTGLTATAGVLSVDTIADNIVEDDIKLENLSTDIDASGYAGVHTLSNTPIANSVQIFLNGLLQEEGSGKDYTLSGTTVTFATQPESGDIIIVHYILND